MSSTALMIASLQDPPLSPVSLSLFESVRVKLQREFSGTKLDEKVERLHFSELIDRVKKCSDNVQSAVRYNTLSHDDMIAAEAEFECALEDVIDLLRLRSKMRIGEASNEIEAEVFHA